MASQISIPAVVLGLQGALNCAMGVYGILRPADWQVKTTEAFGGIISRPAGYSLSLQLLSMGIFTIFAASQRSVHRRGLIARACLHLMAGHLFWFESEKDMRSPAALDIGFGVMNALVVPFVGANSVA